MFPPDVLELWKELAPSSNPQSSGPTLIERYRGVLLGIAVGNLLGIPAEGRSKKHLRARFPDGLREINSREKNLPWDDDLAQTVLVAEALLESETLSLDDLGRRMLKWSDENGRGMGNLTRRVLRKLGGGIEATDASRIVWEEDGQGPAGNGAVMRCSPVALRYRDQPQRLVEETLLSAAVTHYDLRCQWSAVAINIALAQALKGRVIGFQPLADFINALGADPRVAEAVLDAEGRSLEELALSQPHRMGYTLKAMQVGLWTLHYAQGFEKTLTEVVNEGGDTDTNGAIAGAVLGSLYGETAVPKRWRECVGESERVVDLAQRLYEKTHM